MATARPRPQVMRLSEAAATRIKELMAKADRPIAGVRVGVKNGGCAGMEYTMEYVDSIGPTDEVVEDKGVKLADRSQGGAVPDRHRDGLEGRQAVVAVRVQQSEPDLGLRLRRIRAADAGEGAKAPIRRRRGALNVGRPVSGADPDSSPSCFPASARSRCAACSAARAIFADG